MFKIQPRATATFIGLGLACSTAAFGTFSFALRYSAPPPHTTSELLAVSVAGGLIIFLLLVPPLLLARRSLLALIVYDLLFIALSLATLIFLHAHVPLSEICPSPSCA